MKHTRYTYLISGKHILIVIWMMFLLLNVPLRASDSFILDNEGENETLPIDMADLSENDQWNKLLYKLEKKSKLPQAYFVDYLFYKTHNLLFKNYKKHSKFEEILASGNYDCVSASLAYSLLLQHFDISHSIIETDFHVFIVIRIDSKDYIFESTDPINGFIKNEAQVLDYIANFKPGNKVVAGSGFQGQMEMINVEDNHINTIYKKINLKQLIGLQYYNQAVYAINLHEYQLAKERMGQALKLYPSDRIQSVFQFISKLEE